MPPACSLRLLELRAAEKNEKQRETKNLALRSLVRSVWTRLVAASVTLQLLFHKREQAPYRKQNISLWWVFLAYESEEKHVEQEQVNHNRKKI